MPTEWRAWKRWPEVHGRRMHRRDAPRASTSGTADNTTVRTGQGQQSSHRRVRHDTLRARGQWRKAKCQDQSLDKTGQSCRGGKAPTPTSTPSQWRGLWARPPCFPRLIRLILHPWLHACDGKARIRAWASHAFHEPLPGPFSERGRV